MFLNTFTWTIILVASSSAAAVVAAPVDINAETLQLFFDEQIPELMNISHAAGMVISTVQDGTVSFQKGYGYANIDKNIPVNPDTTGFRVGSISKLFVWVAILQLVEQEKLDLNEDINTYLKLGSGGEFQIPNETFPGQPITLSHIMS